MKKNKDIKRIAIIGGGPSGMFMYKRLIESGRNFEVTIFEKKQDLGAGMPYSEEGANFEHITNVSDNEIPTIVTSVEEWAKTAPQDLLTSFNINPANFNEYKVLPRLFFGTYLAGQFELLKALAAKTGINTKLYIGHQVVDVIDQPELAETWVELKDGHILKFDQVVICTGHRWPHYHENVLKGYYDSPYPPSKLNLKINHPVAIKGSSLTAIDAIRTLARNNGKFALDNKGKLSYKLDNKQPNFKMVMHSRNGMLPAVRFHLEDSHLKNESLLTHEEINQHRIENDGFVALDFLFEKNFKAQFINKDYTFYQRIKDLNLEEFVSLVMEIRENLEPFQLLKAEYIEAAKSIKRHESIYWKELLSTLSFALNYPAKYFAAEDMLRLQKVLMPLISIVIAFVPQSSCEELLALNEVGVLTIVSVGDESDVKLHENGGVDYCYSNDLGEDVSVYYQTFIDCVGQPHLNLKDFPFKSLINDRTISTAQLKFKSSVVGAEIKTTNSNVLRTEAGDYYLKISGIGINDDFQVIDNYGSYNDRIYIMAVPYIGGFNPDYSGLDFCEEASGRIIESML